MVTTHSEYHDIKELESVPQFFKLHPIYTMLSEDRECISNALTITDQARIALHCWLAEYERNVPLVPKAFVNSVGQGSLSSILAKMRAS